MDLVQEIKTRIEALRGTASESGIKASVRHIEVAERYLARGQEEQDEDLFNDVVYRSNHAFEGMLKEAYAVLTESDASSKSPNEIEQHLLKGKVLSQRVLDLFQNYRQKWRNPSTHDHTLFFRAQEALLAIVSVSAFSLVLLDQITEVLSFRKEEAEAIKKKDIVAKHLQGYETLSFLDQVVALLEAFSTDLPCDSLSNVRETELLGRLGGFLTAIDPGLEIKREMKFEKHIRPDLVLSKNHETVIVEMKRFRGHPDVVDSAVIQVSNYLRHADLQNAVVYVPPFEMDQEMRKRHFTTASGRDIVVLSPERKGGEDEQNKK